MLSLSREFPKVKFLLIGCGELPDDQWRQIFISGKSGVKALSFSRPSKSIAGHQNTAFRTHRCVFVPHHINTLANV